MKGYKVFNTDWTCREFQYEVGKTYTHDGTLKVCGNGFHFCEKAVDCFNYYNFNPNNKVAEVEAVGDVLTDGDKSVTNKLVIVREVEWAELLTIVNTGKGNTGYLNSGNWNSGNLNSTNYSSGVFNSKEETITMFNKPTNMTLREFRNSKYALALRKGFELTKWIDHEDLPEEEQTEKTRACGGKLITKSYKQAWAEKWEITSEEDKSIIKSMPNFDSEVFFEITGIRI